MCSKVAEFDGIFHCLKGYIPELSKADVPEELKGKEREIFGNMKQILEWHKRYQLLSKYALFTIPTSGISLRALYFI